jgi:PAS domain S-box-containing protein
MCLACAEPRDWAPGDIDLLTAVAQRGWLAAEWASAQDRLRRSEALVRAVAESVPDPLFAIDRDHRFILANPATLAVIGLSEGDVLGRTVRECGFTSREIEMLWGSNERVMQEGRAERMDEEVGDRVYQAAKVPLRGPDGAVVGLVGISRDITAERTYARTLEGTVADRTAALSATIASLEQLLYSIAHDLRAPNRAMHGLAELLELEYGARLDERGRLYLERIKGAAARSDVLIRDLLRYGLLAHTEIPLETVDTDAVVHHALLDQEALVRERGASVRVCSPLPTVCANATLLKQLVSNLVGNALTHAPPESAPEVEVSAEVRPDGVELRVDDRGRGIDPAHAERVFEPFVRLDGSDTPGTGIGLAIVRRAAERMRGAVGVVPRPGGGSRFWVRLPPACDGPVSLHAAAEKP